MNSNMIKLVMLAATLAVVAPAQAQPEDGPEDGPRMERMEGHGMHGRRGGKMLDLSDEQKKKLKTLRRARRDAITPLKDKLQDELEALGAQVKAGAADKDLAPALERVTALREKLDAEKKKYREQMAAILTPTQRAKMLTARHGRGHGKGWRR